MFSKTQSTGREHSPKGRKYLDTCLWKSSITTNVHVFLYRKWREVTDPLGMAVCGSVSQLLPWACFRCRRVEYNTSVHSLAPKSQATALNWARSQVTSSTSHCLFWSSLQVLSFLSPEPFPPPRKHTLSSELSKMCRCVFSLLKCSNLYATHLLRLVQSVENTPVIKGQLC